MALVYCYGDTALEDATAKDTAEVLTHFYPNHSWWVECKQGVLIIKHMEASGFRGIIGMLRKVVSLPTSSLAFRKEILRAGGELLERAGLPRSARTDDPVIHIDLDDDMHKHWHRPIHLPTIH